MSDAVTAGRPGAPTPMPAPPFGAIPSQGGLLRVVPNATLNAMDSAELANKERKRLEARMEPALEELASLVRKKFEEMKRHRNSADGWTDRMLNAMRMFNGEYAPDKAAAIREFGGSDIYAGIVAVKCRAATALLRDIYLAQGDRSWAVVPTPVPTIPDDTHEAIEQLMEAEVAKAAYGAAQGVLDPATGQPVPAPSEEEIALRRVILENAADDAVRRKAREEAIEAQRYLDDLLVEGGFYKALSEFLMDLPLFPFACIRGPVVYMTPSITWEKDATGKAKLVKKNKARMYWRRVSPFDVWFTGGASTIEGSDIVYRDRKSRAEINAMIDVPGYNSDKIKELLLEYPDGYTESQDVADATRAAVESRENPNMNASGMFDLLEFHGSVQGKPLREFGMSRKDVPEEALDYTVQLWMIGRFVIKVQLSPSPRERPPFYITSYDKVPGTLVGNAVPDMLSDIQDVCNATLRGLVNNIAMSSGPQVAINDTILGNGEDTERIWPWRVWRYAVRPGAQAADPVKFFQPVNNAQALMAVYEKFTQIADETSAIPRYVTGSDRIGGAGRTASGLAMLMGNASKMLQTVASNIDTDVFEPLLQFLYDIVMLTDKTGRLRGDERIQVKGVQVAMQRETERQRQIEFMQATANPIDNAIVGMRGRGAILRTVSKTLGMDGEVVVPSDEDLMNREKAATAAANAAPPPGMMPPDEENPTGQGQQQGGEETGPSAIQGPRTNLQQQTPG